MKKGERKNRRPAAVAALVATAIALLALAGGYAYAKYAISLGASSLTGEVDPMVVTSSLTYKDATLGEEDEAMEASGGDLGTVLFGEDGVSFTLTLKNTGRVPVTCSLSLNEGYLFKEDSFSVSVGDEEVELEEGDVTVTTEGQSAVTFGPIDPPGEDADEAVYTFGFTVQVNGSWYMTIRSANGEGGMTEEYIYYYDGIYTRELEISITYVQAG